MFGGVVGCVTDNEEPACLISTIWVPTAPSRRPCIVSAGPIVEED